MRRLTFWVLIFGLAAVLASAQAWAGQPGDIILIGWDGAQRDHVNECLDRGELPNLKKLASEGTKVDIHVSERTETKPGWTQLMTGYNAEITGVYHNGLYQPIPEGYTLFEKIENHFGNENVVTMFISGKAEHTGGACVGDPTTKDGEPVIEDLGQPWCITKNHLDYYENGKFSNPTVGNRALELIDLHQEDHFVAFFVFRSPDANGHLEGESSTYYSQGIIDVDYWLGQIVAKLESLGIYDRTLVYVLSDHGFGEGIDTHGNAPYTIWATNDSSVIRSGDRKDIAATVLERFNISRAAIGAAPPVNGYSLYFMPPFATVPEGEAFLDYPGAPVCSVNLSLIGMIRPLGSTQCIPPTGGTGDNSGYCTTCGNGICDPPENRCNCPGDCTR